MAKKRQCPCQFEYLVLFRNEVIAAFEFEHDRSRFMKITKKDNSGASWEHFKEARK